jgi:hypothetical protein
MLALELRFTGHTLLNLMAGTNEEHACVINVFDGFKAIR